jgi:5,5'-dehydrodivanillate O-demethylase
VAFRCAHRGTQLSTGWVEGEDLRCFYHGWKYGPDGQCIDQPAEPEPFCNRIRIRGYPTEEYLGFIFVYMGEGDPPPLPRYPLHERDGVRENYATFWPSNYFNSFDNDGVHTYFVHRRPGNDFTEWAGKVPRVQVEEDEWGVKQTMWRPNGKVDVGHNGMPNVAYFHAGVRPGGDIALREAGVRPQEDRVVWRVPVDDENHWRFAVDLVPLTGEAAETYRERRAAYRANPSNTLASEIGTRILAGEITLADVRAIDPRANLTNVEDIVSQAGQGRIVNREAEHLAYSDVRVVFTRKLWERELTRFQNGEPTKEWKLPPELGG